MKSNNPTKTSKKRADLLLILSLLLLSALLLGLWQLTRRPGEEVVVTVDGKEIGRYPLSEDREVRISSENDGYNVLVIRNGEAFVREASCPDGICVADRPVSRDGEIILCLPNRVAIRIEGGDGDAEVDVIA